VRSRAAKDVMLVLNKTGEAVSQTLLRYNVTEKNKPLKGIDAR
jgi:hypothetical protein